MKIFVEGEIYKRTALHDKYGGQEQGGISTPSKHDFIMLFSSETGETYGYTDSWKDNKIFHYTGEGQEGHMSFIRGNRAIRDHLANGKDLHLFEYVRQGYVRYVGQMVYKGHEFREGADKTGAVRKIIVFQLERVETSP
jgi:5-methylcytosine-specific restriction enzyme A